MEQKSTSMLKPAMNAGIILAIVSILFSVIVWITKLIENMGIFGSFVIMLVSLVITVVLLIVFTKRYRDINLGGQITFKDAFLFGLFIVVLSTVITSLYNYIFHNFIDPGYQERVMTSMQDKVYQMMSSKGVPEAQIEETLNQMAAQEKPTPLQLLRQSVIFGLIGGSIMSLISSAIIKKNINNEDAFDEAMEEVKSEE
ncbi:DUF4199 domain-containing protein [Sunxiuqinia sp. A32]|uniref:DUF4199 domain-containing protein n=1 Tax=Sunxiuqinia sp. A32 TaxID=3461496 RepID=UPI004045498E